MPCVPKGDNLKSYPFFIWKIQNKFVYLSMKKIKIVLIVLLGVIALQSSAKPKYRIESWVVGGTRLYLPQQKVWFKTSMGTFPFRVWVSADYPSMTQQQAEEVIGFWKQNESDRKSYKKSEFITIK
jgi:hypothetical protein